VSWVEVALVAVVSGVMFFVFGFDDPRYLPVCFGLGLIVGLVVSVVRARLS
jgi:uncharacterized membrane protein